MKIIPHPPTLIVFLSLFCSAAFCSSGTITGSIIEANGSPLPFATVLLLRSTDSTLVKGEVTDMDGKYSFSNVQAGEYLLSVTMVGYVTSCSELFSLSGNGTKNMGAITIMEDVEQLKTVEIVAQKPLFEQKIDRMVVNIANSVTSAGSNALEVLERSPGVLVDRLNGSISMAGKGGVVVMINDKISRMSSDAVMQMLEGMNADNIEKIELITTPPSNFDAEGNAGFINIVLKENPDKGTNGSYAVNAGYGNYGKFGGSLNLNHRKNKVNLFGDYNYAYNRSVQVFTNYRNVFFQGNPTETSSSSQREPTLTQNHNLRLGADFQLSEKTIFGVLGTWSQRKWTMDAFNDVIVTESGIPVSALDINIYELNLWNNYLGNLNLQHKFTKNQTLNVDFDYAYYRQNNPSDYTIKYFDESDNLEDTELLDVGKETPIQFTVGKADYTNNIGEKVIWEAGMKGAFSTFDNNISLASLQQQGWVLDPDFTADYTLNEDILATYTSLTLKMDDKTNLKFGLRYEHTASNLGTPEEAGIVDRRYGNLFPSVFFSREIDKNNKVQFSYSRRINRPDFTQLAPWIIFSDPTTYMTGNVALQPSITDAVKADYRFKTLLFSIQYSYEDEAIARFQPTVDPNTNRQVNISVNSDYSQVLAATLSFPVDVTNWWQMQNNFMAFWQKDKIRLEGGASISEQKSLRLNTVQSFKLPEGFSLEFAGNYSSPSIRGIVRWKATGFLNIGLQKKFSGNSGRLSLNVNDVLRTFRWTGETTDPELDFQYRGSYLFSERSIRLTYSRNFGNKKVKDSRNRQTGSAEEQGRVN